MRELWKRARDGEEQAFRELLVQFDGRIRGLANRRYLVGGDFEDLVQEGRIGLWRAVGTYRDAGVPFGVFAYFCIQRQLVTALRRYNRVGEGALNGAVSLQTPVGDEADDRVTIEDTVAASTVDVVAQVIAAEELAVLLGQMRSRLSSFEMEALLLSGAGYLPHQMAPRLGVTTKSAENATRRGRAKLGIRRLPRTEPERMAQLYRSGMTCAEVGEVVGISPNGVVKALARVGVARRPKGNGSRLAFERERQAA